MARHIQVYETAEKLREALTSGKAMTTRELSAVTGITYIRNALVLLMDAGEVLKVCASNKKVAHHYIKTSRLGKTVLKQNQSNAPIETPAGVLMLQSILLNMRGVSA